MPKLLARSFLVAFTISFIAILLAVFPAQAAPANPNPIPLTQPDGTTFMARQWGDEWNHGFETIGGYTIILDAATGYWVYAAAGDSAVLAPANVNGRHFIVGADEPPGLVPGVRPAEMRANPNLDQMSSHSPLNKNSGTQPVLVILAQFDNTPGTYNYSEFSNKFFADTASVKSFYQQASRNAFSISPAAEMHGTVDDGVVGWVTIGSAHPCSTSSCTDNALRNVAKNAIIAADLYVNYADFDTDKDGYISTAELHLVVIVAGFEASYDYSLPAVWAHEWSLDGVVAPVADGVTISNGMRGGGYVEIGEKHGSHAATIGTMAHELGHDISWPDLYDTSLVTEGVGEWSIMGSGNWNFVSGYPGSSPAFPDAWLKWYQGWIAPISISGTSSAITINPIEGPAGSAYLLGANPNGVDWNFLVTSGSGEYFLVENRQYINYDAALPGCGLLVWHINESATSSNSANAVSKPLVSLEQADGANHLVTKYNRGDTADPYPGTMSKTSITNLTTPNSKLYSTSDSGVRVTEISSTPTTCSLASPAVITATLTSPATIIYNHRSFVPLLKTPSYLSVYGTVTDHGAALGNVAVWLEFYNGSSWSMTSILTTVDGRYEFWNVPTLAPGQKFFVRFPNIEDVSTRLWYWDTRLISTYSLGEQVNMGTFDVADIVLGAPANYASVPFPVIFNWIPRAATPNDSYLLVIAYNESQVVYFSPTPLGYVASTTLTAKPAGVDFNLMYGWFPAVVSADGGFGESYYYKNITFLNFNPSSPLLLLNPPIPRSRSIPILHNMQ